MTDKTILKKGFSMKNYLTKQGVCNIFKLPTLYVRGLFAREDFPSTVIKVDGRPRTVVDAFDLVMFMNYKGTLKPFGKKAKRKKR